MHPYNRKLVQLDGRMLIESVCSLCGFRLVGSMTETLERDEREHTKSCPAQEQADATSG